MCSGCEIHDGCLADWNHITWHARFAAPGEPLCYAVGTVSSRGGYICELPGGHSEEWHQARDGAGWPRLSKSATRTGNLHARPDRNPNS